MKWYLKSQIPRTAGTRGGRIYVIEALGLERIKIGWTGKTAHERLRQLQNSSPVPLRLHGFASGTLHDERAVHARLAMSRVGRTEWFRLTPEALEEAARLLGRPLR